MTEYKADGDIIQDLQYPQALAKQIRNQFNETNSYGVEISPEKFQLLVDRMHNIVYSLISQLRSLDVNQHVITWTIVVDEIFEQLFIAKENLDIICPLNKAAMLKVGQIVSEANEMFISFVSCVKVQQLHQNYFEPLLLHVLASCESNLAVDCGSINHSGTLLKYCVDYVKYIHLKDDNAKTFHLLSKLLKVFYNSGNFTLVKDLIELLSPELPLKYSKIARLNYKDIERYYKYVSFNFLSLSIESIESINDAYCWEADKYYKCLISLPSMDYNFIPHLKESIDNLDKLDDEQKQKSIDKLLARQEVSLMFVLNSLLMCHNLEEVISLSVQVKQESEMLYKTLTFVLNRKHKNSPRDSNSIILTEEPTPPILHCQSLSSIVINGSYEEKKAAVQFMIAYISHSKINPIQKQFNLENDGTTAKKLIENTDHEKFPGYVLYYKVLDLITKLFSLLQLKYVIRTIGNSKLDLTTLQGLIGRNNIESVLTVKPLLKCTEIESTYEFEVNDLFKIDKKSMITHQVELSEEINEIEGLID